MLKNKVVGIVAFAFLALFSLQASYAGDIETVSFKSLDGKAMLVAYMFTPEGPGPYPAVVMMHGRSGVYSSLANGVYDEEKISARHKAWGRFWAERGYAALLVDSFGPRGYPEGFKKYSYEERPSELNEVTIRPLDAYAALNYLRSRPEIVPDRIGLQGWSNGGSATLSTIADSAPGITDPDPLKGFRAAISFYPGCGLKGKYDDYYKPYAPVLLFAASDDEEVSPNACVNLAQRGKSSGGDIDIFVYKEAQHSFDNPSKKVQAVEANRTATADAQRKAEDFFRTHLEAGLPKWTAASVSHIDLLR
ncbi:MAG: hypothetical protein A2X55_02585 [Nitrospirae bacterium GWB2_47_37]|nr:MAG: hypothetical protein A2Z82_10700 [Nitrospirae bacterium GWA2_46_11]OGW22789.1 MAG: hypothetical protein A2X55_02585 [Nitrospirae bacterium GWB2_47_37]